MPRRYETSPRDDDADGRLTIDDVTILALAGVIVIAIIGVMVWAVETPLANLIALLRLGSAI